MLHLRPCLLFQLERDQMVVVVAVVVVDVVVADDEDRSHV